ncbi:hypothetical protein B0T17DRAFT_506054 [Bombardia bombarda]|uniref:Uncharacterized protein n=1 Tax=Bombardia bombarda TaxID=252184 RepID=A0AA39X8Y5_9PEZI|nr:hypothetical protein B0T17DRAFT_506054 [Bombardia bombarda]
MSPITFGAEKRPATGHLEDAFARFQATDHVFQMSFVDGGVIIVLLSEGISSRSISRDVEDFITCHSCELFFSPSLLIPEGPYFIKEGSLRQAWRLYEDELCTFVSAVVPADDGDDSRVSGNVEYAPIVGSLVGARGTDVMLLQTAQAALSLAGWPTTVLTGRNMFRVGDNIRNSIVGQGYV